MDAGVHNGRSFVNVGLKTVLILKFLHLKDKLHLLLVQIFVELSISLRMWIFFYACGYYLRVQTFYYACRYWYDLMLFKKTVLKFLKNYLECIIITKHIA